MIDNIVDSFYEDNTKVIEAPVIFNSAEELSKSTEKVVVSKKIKTISYSQYAKWLKCPNSWKLSYIDNLEKFENSINTAFGNAVHTAVQLFLKTLYTEGAIAADSLDLIGIFDKEYDIETAKVINPKPTDEKLTEFKNDGKAILDYFTSPANRLKHFPSKVFEVIGVELPLKVPIRGGTIVYKGYLDIVLKEKSTGKIHILDFKTSTFGWNKWQKADRTKLDQLLLYKRFYSQVFKVPMNVIEIEFIVLKRKLYEDVGFPQQRIQRISPTDGKISMKEVETTFLDFINDCFDSNGDFNKDKTFIKNPGKAKKNCKYCSFADMVDKDGNKICDQKE